MNLSINISPSVSNIDLFNELANTKNTSTTQTNATNSTDPSSATQGSESSDPTSDSSSSSALATDLAALLKSLGSNDVTGAKAALAKVEADIKAEDPSASSTSSTDSTSGSQSSNPLEKLLNQLGTDLKSGSTSSALSDLTNFLVNNGQISGSALNVNA